MRLPTKAAAVIAVLLVAALPAHSKKAVLTFALWGTQDYLKAEQEAARLFSKTNPNIEVKPLLIAGNYRETIVTSIAGGKAPDIMIVSVEDFGYLSKHGFLMDLGPWYSAEKAYEVKDVYDILWRAFTVNGRKYGLPLNCGPVVEYFNPALFSRAGLPTPTQYEAQNAWNWDTFRDCAQRMTVDANGDGKPEQFGFWNNDNGIMWGAHIKANGGDILDDTVNPTKVLLDSKAAAQALTFLQELLYKYRAAPVPRDNFPFATDAFVKGRLGMYEWWPSRLAVHAGSKMTDYDIAFLPKAPGGGRSTDFGTSALVIARNSKNKDAAWRYAAYRCFSKSLYENVSILTALPPLKSLSRDKKVLDAIPIQSKQVFFDSLAYGQLRITWEYQHELWPALNSAVGAIWQGKSDVAQALKAAAKAGDQIIAKRLKRK